MLNRNFCFGLLCLFLINLNAQVSSIELPKCNDSIKINRFTPIISLYLDNMQNVFLENEPIKISDIGKELSYIRYKLDTQLQHRIFIFLYIDKEVKYTVVDEIKTQLASSYFNRIFYKTNTTEDKDLLSGIAWTNHQSFFHIEKPVRVLSDKEQEKNRRFNDSIANVFGDLIPPPPPPPIHWIFDVQSKIYSDNEEAINESLKGRTYNCVIMNNQGYETSSEMIKFGDEVGIKKLFYSQEVVFVKFCGDLKYSEYLKAISDFKELDSEKKGYFFELSKEIEDIHKLSEISLCD